MRSTHWWIHGSVACLGEFLRLIALLENNTNRVDSKGQAEFRQEHVTKLVFFFFIFSFYRSNDNLCSSVVGTTWTSPQFRWVQLCAWSGFVKVNRKTKKAIWVRTLSPSAAAPLPWPSFYPQSSSIWFSGKPCLLSAFIAFCASFVCVKPSTLAPTTRPPPTQPSLHVTEKKLRGFFSFEWAAGVQEWLYLSNAFDFGVVVCWSQTSQRCWDPGQWLSAPPYWIRRVCERIAAAWLSCFSRISQEDGCLRSKQRRFASRAATQGWDVISEAETGDWLFLSCYSIIKRHN